MIYGAHCQACDLRVLEPEESSTRAIGALLRLHRTRREDLFADLGTFGCHYGWTVTEVKTDPPLGSREYHPFTSQGTLT